MARSKFAEPNKHTVLDTFILVIIIVCGTATIFVKSGGLFSWYFWIRVILCVCFSIEAFLSILHIFDCGRRMAKKEQYGYVDLVRYSIGLFGFIMLLIIYADEVISKF